MQPIAEKFSISPATGAGSMSVGVALSPGRGLSPEMTVGYSTGAGNGLFGMGWGLSVPSISRKTDKGLPQYRDAHSNDADDSDTFILSGSEDLVRLLVEDPSASGSYIRKPALEAAAIAAVAAVPATNTTPATPAIAAVPAQTRYRYMPRTEGSFLRIERVVTAAQPAVPATTTTPAIAHVHRQTHWEVTTKDNVTHTYGRSLLARIAHPKSPSQVFQWLLEETRDDKGNIVRYQYKAEDRANAPGKLYEVSRRDGLLDATAQRYLKRILYGNKVGIALDDAVAPNHFHFEVVLDYGEHDDAAPRPEPSVDVNWPARKDPFSSYRAGFDVRTYRLCHRILMFHRFAELDATAPTDGSVDTAGNPILTNKALLVRSTEFTYERAHRRHLSNARHPTRLRPESECADR